MITLASPLANVAGSIELNGVASGLATQRVDGIVELGAFELQPVSTRTGSTSSRATASR